MMKTTVFRLTAWLMTTVMLLTMMIVGTAQSSSAASVKGDVHADGVLNTTDVRVYLQTLISADGLSDAQKLVADVNGDGLFNTSDTRLMLDYILNGIPETDEEESVRAIWIPYMEVEELLVSGNVTSTKAAIDACFDDCVARGANRVYFHVRANSDAYYNSSVFDINPEATALVASGFDPLTYAVTQAHARGLKIEAWVNPYRIGSNASRAKTDAIFQYSGRYYYVPSDADVQALVVAGIKELVNNYDIDGVQFDDYFYPEGSVPASSTADFETADYNAYKNSGGTLGVADWRRSVVNNLIAAVYKTCHTRSGCIFGISPACDFKANYDDMYVDAETWAKTPGYVDYLAPQLYVGFDHSYMPYDSIIAEWNALTRHSGVKMLAGLALYKTGLLDDTWAGTKGRTEWANNTDILTRQIALAKTLKWNGIALYSHQSFKVDSTRDETVAVIEM
ncbi:MAG: family 10 glycosylhydrolase, partial [Clostridia bacterium]|nr:family 10 glycosylhydrolase [Clostridia bacterium]